MRQNYHSIKAPASDGYYLLAAAVLRSAYDDMLQAYKIYLAVVNNADDLTASGRRLKRTHKDTTLKDAAANLKHKMSPFTTHRITTFLTSPDVEPEAFIIRARKVAEKQIIREVKNEQKH